MEISVKNMSSNILKLIQPELLTVEDLINILSERGVGSDLLTAQSKDQLVSLFKRVALPLPQREFRKNYIGSLIMKMRKQRELVNHTSIDEQKSYEVGVSGSVASLKRTCEEKSNRLKPPPDLNNSDRKKIRLSTASRTPDVVRQNSDSDLDKIVIKQRKSSESRNDSSTDSESNHRSEADRLSNITQKTTLPNNNEVETNDTCNGSKSGAHKKIILKRNHITSLTSASSTDNTSNKSPTEPDKKRKPIAWP